MNDFTTDELATLADVFSRATLTASESLAIDLQQRVNTALEQRRELEDMDFDDCLDGACKL